MKMKAKHVLSAAALAVGLCQPRPLWAWGKLGHEVVALIAQNRLAQDNSGALGLIQQVLGPGVGLDQLAACADEIKRNAIDCPGVGTIPMSPETKGWHFVDVAYDQSQDPTQVALVPYCKAQNGQHPAGAAPAQSADNAGDCAADQIVYWQGVLGQPVDANNPIDSQDRKTALMFLVHLVGDASQPMHCVDDNDAGGNGKPIDLGKDQTPPAGLPAGTVEDPREMSGMNLHHLWDNILMSDDQERAASASGVFAAIGPRSPATACAATDVLCGVRECYGAAQKIYEDYYLHNPGGRATGAVAAPSKPGPGAKSPGRPAWMLDLAAYQSQFQEVAYDQLELGGLRLAAMLSANAPGSAAQAGVAANLTPKLTPQKVKQIKSRVRSGINTVPFPSSLPEP